MTSMHFEIWQPWIFSPFLIAYRVHLHTGCGCTLVNAAQEKLEGLVTSCSHKTWRQSIKKSICQRHPRSLILSDVVEIDEFSVFAVAISSYVSEIRYYCTLRRHPVLKFCRHQQGWPWMTLDHGWPIQLQVRFADSTLDVGLRMSWLSELTTRDWMNVGLNCQR